jgi:HPt (histidine-containing phosphotransfer) domain-containing protein
MSAPKKTEDPAPFLRQEALDRIGGDDAFLDELLGLYDKEFLARLEELKKALAKKNFESVREIGHGLKGSSANLSLPGLREAAWALETAGREKNPDAARFGLETLEREYQRFKKFLG